MKNILVMLLLVFVSTLQLFAQETETNFTALKTKVAEIDTKHFVSDNT